MGRNQRVSAGLYSWLGEYDGVVSGPSVVAERSRLLLVVGQGGEAAGEGILKLV